MNKIKLKGTKNIRDLGNTITKYGIIKENKLIRSSSLDRLTEKDIELLETKYKIATIIDLRTSRERDNDPDMDIENVTYLHIPIFDESIPGITHENDKKAKNINNIDLKKMYKEMLSGDSLKQIEKVIKTIINLSKEDYPVIFHCSEGKDRTGVIAAILLLILKTDKETIIKDYLFTNKTTKKKIYKCYFKKYTKSQLNNIKNIYLAKKEYIETFFDTIDNQYNGIENFITNQLKLKEVEIKKFRKIVIEK